MQRRLRVKYHVMLMIEDAAERGWNSTDLSRVTGLNKGTISRFLSGKVQTPKVAKQLSDALGYPLSRYQIRKQPVPVQEERVA